MTSEKVAIITGANKGIGLAIVKKLCSVFKGTVYLTCRDEMRGLQAVKALEQEGFSPKFHQLDIDSKESIAKLHDFLKRTHGGIDVLVNNAAMAFKNSATEPFSYQTEVTIRVNFTGTLNVCEALFPLLRKHARVVNMSSYAGKNNNERRFLRVFDMFSPFWKGHLSRINGHEPEASELRKRLSSAKLTKEDLMEMINSFISLAKEGTHVQAGWPNTAYGVSKVAVSALARIYQREFDEKRENDDLIINNVHPGLVDTDMTSHTGPMTPNEGAQAPVYAALLPASSKDNPKGDFIWLDKTTVDWVHGSLPIKYF